MRRGVEETGFFQGSFVFETMSGVMAGGIPLAALWEENAWAVFVEKPSPYSRKKAPLREEKL